MLNMGYGLVFIGLATLSVEGPVAPFPPSPSMIADAASLCVKAISPTGIDDRGFSDAGWAAETIPQYPGIILQRKNGMRITLGMRKEVGGSCIINYKIPDAYDFRETSLAVATAVGAQFVFGINLPDGANLRLSGKSFPCKLTLIPA